MPNKSFSIYSNEEHVAEDQLHLVIEIARSHLACVVTKNKKTTITDCELFTFGQNESEKLEDLLEGVFTQSQLLKIRPTTVKLYLNNEFCIPVPIFNFNKEIAAEYLNVIFGDDGLSKIQFDHLPVEPGIINVYRAAASCLGWVNQKFNKFSIHHSYSNIIRRVLSIESKSAGFISIQFYNTFMVVAVVKNDRFQLIQSFYYDGPDDVLFYVLKITEQLQLPPDALTIQISGMIDPEFQLYRELITYFKHVEVESLDAENLQLNVGEHPLHYFTPFFNLAL